MATSASLLDDELQRLLFNLVTAGGSNWTFGESAASFSRLLSQTASPGSIIIALRLMLQVGKLEGCPPPAMAGDRVRAASRL